MPRTKEAEKSFTALPLWNILVTTASYNLSPYQIVPNTSITNLFRDFTHVLCSFNPQLFIVEKTANGSKCRSPLDFTVRKDVKYKTFKNRM